MAIIRTHVRGLMTQDGGGSGFGGLSGPGIGTGSVFGSGSSEGRSSNVIFKAPPKRPVGSKVQIVDADWLKTGIIPNIANIDLGTIIERLPSWMKTGAKVSVLPPAVVRTPVISRPPVRTWPPALCCH